MMVITTTYIRYIIVITGLFFSLSACSQGDKIPSEEDEVTENSDVEREENTDLINHEVEQEAKSIKAAAKRAVEIIENDAQQEIDIIKQESDSLELPVQTNVDE